MHILRTLRLKLTRLTVSQGLAYLPPVSFRPRGPQRIGAVNERRVLKEEEHAKTAVHNRKTTPIPQKSLPETSH